MPDAAEILMTARQAAGISRAALAESLGVAPNTLRNWEQGVASPSVDVWIEALRLCGVVVERRRVATPALQ